MKIIQAMKQVKANKEQIVDLQGKIATNCAHLNYETPLYGTETGKKIQEWLQGCTDLAQDNIQLLTAIQKTNLATNVTIELGGKQVTKNIAEWVWRRREYAELDQKTFTVLTDRNLKEGQNQTTTGVAMDIKIVRYYDPVKRDEALAMYRSEPHAIDSALEVVNAVTELLV